MNFRNICGTGGSTVGAMQGRELPDVKSPRHSEVFSLLQIQDALRTARPQHSTFVKKNKCCSVFILLLASNLTSNTDVVFVLNSKGITGSKYKHLNYIKIKHRSPFSCIKLQLQHIVVMPSSHYGIQAHQQKASDQRRISAIYITIYIGAKYAAESHVGESGTSYSQWDWTGASFSLIPLLSSIVAFWNPVLHIMNLFRTVTLI